MNITKFYARIRSTFKCLLFIVVIVILGKIYFNSNPINVNYLNLDSITFTDGKNETGYDSMIVPNLVHFIHFTSKVDSDLSFIAVVCIRAAFFNQKPDKIMIHANITEFAGKYWDMVKDIPTLEVIYTPAPFTIFGRTITYIQHVSDIVRILVLMEYGGIIMDTDSYIVKSLDYYRKFEFSLGWPERENMGTQMFIAHKNARFLKLYYESYRKYNGALWYYNCGQLPTKSILNVNPSLVHRETTKLNVVFSKELGRMLYGNDKSRKWMELDAIHVAIRHRRSLEPTDKMNVLDEKSIKMYDRPFGEMARIVLYGKMDHVKDTNAEVLNIKDIEM